MRHDILTTIVEIDPAVYKAARTFFGLPDLGSDKVFLEDARTWVTKQRATIEKGDKTTRFDIVVHDCFSGGGVPQHIFTTEFWDDLKTVMEPEGILVVVSNHNYRPNSHSSFDITLHCVELCWSPQISILAIGHQYSGKELPALPSLPRHVQHT